MSGVGRFAGALSPYLNPLIITIGGFLKLDRQTIEQASSVIFDLGKAPSKHMEKMREVADLRQYLREDQALAFQVGREWLLGEELINVLHEHTARQDFLVLKGVRSAKFLQEWAEKAPYDLRLMPVINSMNGMQAVNEIARAHRKIEAISFDPWGMAKELENWLNLPNRGLLPGDFRAWRQSIAEAAAKAGICAVDSPTFSWHSDELDAAYKVDLENMAQMGFAGKMTDMPGRLGQIRSVFAPTPKEPEASEAGFCAFYRWGKARAGASKDCGIENKR